MLVKLLNVDLIRTFGGSTVEMSEPQAIKYIKRGQGIEVKQKSKFDNNEKKLIDGPPENKAIFSPPEEKLFNHNEVLDNIIFPKPNDTLFPQIGK